MNIKQQAKEAKQLAEQLSNEGLEHAEIVTKLNLEFDGFFSTMNGRIVLENIPDYAPQIVIK